MAGRRQLVARPRPDRDRGRVRRSQRRDRRTRDRARQTRHHRRGREDDDAHRPRLLPHAGVVLRSRQRGHYEFLATGGRPTTTSTSWSSGRSPTAARCCSPRARAPRPSPATSRTPDDHGRQQPADERQQRPGDMAQLRHDHRSPPAGRWRRTRLGRGLPQTAGTFTNNGALNFYAVRGRANVTGGTFTGNPPTLRQGSLALTGGTGVARIQYGKATLADGRRQRLDDPDRGSRQRHDAPEDPGGRHADQPRHDRLRQGPGAGDDERVELVDRHPRRRQARQHRHDPRRRRLRRPVEITAAYAATRATRTRRRSCRTGRSRSARPHHAAVHRRTAARRPWPPVYALDASATHSTPPTRACCSRPAR